jgi:predicted ATPase/DNA-binding SARP family transcriptional activator
MIEFHDEEMAMSRVTATLLGLPQIERAGQRVEIGTRKAIALFAYLVLTERRHSRETLAALFWPDYDAAHARAALRNTLYELKQALGGIGLDIAREDVGFAADAELAVDVRDFQRAIAQCRAHAHPPTVVCGACLEALTAGVALYHGDLLAGFNVDASREFEEWRLFQTEAWRNMLADVLERLSRGYRDRSSWPAAIDSARRWQALDPLDESALRRVMQVYALAGERASALTEYKECIERLHDEMGVPPQAETTELYEAIKKNELGRAASRSPVGNLAAFVPSSPFIGREAELIRVASWLDEPDARLLTLLGAGGMGKTSLALESALEYGARFEHGSYFVPLASVGADRLVSAIAQALGLAFHGRSDPQIQLFSYLREKHLLLVLDNFEQLKERAGLIPGILAHAPRVRILVTSREWLNLPQEVVLDLQGLPFPKAKDLPGSQLEDYGAVQLFVQNARRVHWSFSLPPEARGVARICALVEGMPLGIELAAAWVRVIPCDEIAQEIERDLGFLATTLGGIPERHRSLRVVFDFSYNRLAAEEQRAFRKLSVFRAGFSRAAAEHVARATLPILATLANHSLLRRRAAGRYDIHELLRQYGEEKLRADPDEDATTREAHATYYADYLHHRQVALKGPGQRKMLQEIGEEIDNLRAAWDWAVEHRRDPEIAQAFDGLFIFLRIRSQFKEGAQVLARAAGVLEETKHALLRGELLARQATFLELLGQFDEARAALEYALAALPPDDPAARSARAFALVELGTVMLRLGDLVQAKQLLEQGQELYQATQDLGGIANALRWLGQIASDLDGNYAASEQLYGASIALYRQVGDQRGVAALLNNSAMAAGDLGKYAEAKQFLRESIALHQELGDRYGIALALNNLGAVEQMEGAYADAWEHFQESSDIRREVGDRFAIALVEGNLGRTAIYLKRYDQAREHLDASLALHREVGDRLGVARTLTKLGVLAMETHEAPAAKDYFLQALELAMASRAPTLEMEILSELAALWANSVPSNARAVELAAFVHRHPTSDQFTKKAAARLLDELSLQLPPEIVLAAQASAQSRELEDVTHEVLADVPLRV